jgi:two-component system, sensor histidine kinase and response regulator
MEPLRVLAVDDEPGMRSGIERTLRSFTVALPEVEGATGFVTEVAESGEQALEMIEARPPDILLLDHKMPGMTGLDVLDHLVKREDKMVTVMVTAYASLDTAVTAIKRGAYDFLAKPFTPDELRTVVSKAAESLILARHARRLMEEKRRVRFEFISVLAHELKAPLGAIEGYLALLKEGLGGPEKQGEMVDRCLIRAEGMRKLIRDLLDMTRIESGQKQREFSQVDLRDAAEIALDGVRPDADARKITLELDAAEGTTLRADRGEVDIILSNLVSNAVKYNRDGGRVDVRIAREDDNVTIAVSDTGIGIAEADQARLFADFVRIKTDATRNILGSGLGLAILKKLATLYRGDVSLASTLDVGSTFTVVLHDAVGDAPPAPAETT